jgi:hypothetical protein
MIAKMIRAEWQLLSTIAALGHEMVATGLYTPDVAEEAVLRTVGQYEECNSRARIGCLIGEN